MQDALGAAAGRAGPRFVDFTHYGQPDYLHAEVRDPRYGALASNLGRRFAKRQREYNRFFNEDTWKRIDPGASHPTGEVNVFGGVSYPVLETARKLYQVTAAQMAANAYRARKLADKDYTPVDSAGSILRKSGHDGMSLKDRLLMSNVNLNFAPMRKTRWVYNEVLGVIRTSG